MTVRVGVYRALALRVVAYTHEVVHLSLLLVQNSLSLFCGETFEVHGASLAMHAFIQELGVELVGNFLVVHILLQLPLHGTL